MANATSTYKNAKGEDLVLSLDIDLKKQSVQEFKVSGSKASQYAEELASLKELVLYRPLQDIQRLKRSDLKAEVLTKNNKRSLAPLSLWLLQKALDDYLGESAHLEEQKDLLCLCFGVGRSDLKREILRRSDYDLPQLIAETKATSACGSCLSLIKQTILDLRHEHGLIKGLDHSKSRYDLEGHWLKIKGLYPGELLVKLDDLLRIWMKRERLTDQFEMDIQKIEGHHIWLKVQSLREGGADLDRFEKILKALGEFWKSEMGVLFFLHLAL
ncbi:MAG: (2Fe-2S)-binding protein [Bacteriovorax sp.]